MEIKDKVFDPFFTTKGVHDGTGIGLSLVHSIITEHNGKLDLNSSPGRGAEFILSFDKVSPEPEAQSEDHELKDLINGFL